MANKTMKQLEEETNARMDKIEDGLNKIVEVLILNKEAPAEAAPVAAATPGPIVDLEEKKAEANNAYMEPVHPDWIADATEKLGEKLDHCEVDYPKNGTPRYTVVIKNEFSNASKSHLQYYKIDRRTVPVTNGFETIKTFNSLVAQNLRNNPPTK